MRAPWRLLTRTVFSRLPTADHRPAALDFHLRPPLHQWALLTPRLPNTYGARDRRRGSRAEARWSLRVLLGFLLSHRGRAGSASDGDWRLVPADPIRSIKLPGEVQQPGERDDAMRAIRYDTIRPPPRTICDHFPVCLSVCRFSPTTSLPRSRQRPLDPSPSVSACTAVPCQDVPCERLARHVDVSFETMPD